MLKRIASYMKGYERYVIGSPVLVIVETICQLIIPLLMAQIINEGILKEDMAPIWRAGVLMVVVALAATFTRAGGGPCGTHPPPGLGGAPLGPAHPPHPNRGGGERTPRTSIPG